MWLVGSGGWQVGHRQCGRRKWNGYRVVGGRRDEPFGRRALKLQFGRPLGGVACNAARVQELGLGVPLHACTGCEAGGQCGLKLIRRRKLCGTVGLHLNAGGMRARCRVYKRTVQHQQVRLAQQSRSQRHALALAAAHLRRGHTGCSGWARGREQPSPRQTGMSAILALDVL